MFIFPKPKKLQLFDGWYDFTDKLVIQLPEGVMDQSYIGIYSTLINNYTAGMTKAVFEFSDKISGVAYISSTPSEHCEKASTEYDYELHTDKAGARLVFNDFSGFVHAFTSFLQLIRIDDGFCSFRHTSVWDNPKLSFRAVHLCVFHETTLEFLKKCISVCGIAKCSHIILEFWGTYRYKCCPTISWRDAYTAEQIKPLITYANSLGMEVIPMLNHMGHASQGRIAIGKHSALDTDLSQAPLFEDDGWSWCTTNPKTQKLLAECRRELCELCGKGDYFHIGFDEAYTFATCRRCSKHDKYELMKQHLIDTNEDIKSLGRRTIMWSDMMHDNSQYDMKIYTCLTGSDEYKIRKDLPRDIIMAEWQYDCAEEFKTATELANDGFDTVTCPWRSRPNIHAAVETVINNGLYGTIATTWHTLATNNWLIPYVAEKMWRGEIEVEHAEHALFTAYHTRRCVPCDGDYARAGICPGELPGIGF